MLSQGFPAETGILIPFVKPYDFALSTRALRAFQPGTSSGANGMRIAVRVGNIPIIIEVSDDTGGAGSLRAISRPDSDAASVRSIVEWVLFTGLDLAPFYRLAEGNSKLSPVINELYGLKPTRPASLFEMAVVAITEQQLSLASAYHIRDRLVQRFGEPAGDLRVFPGPAALAGATPEELRSCGLSRQKAGYIQELARRITTGELDVDSLKQMNNEKARETITGWRGFGRWSADYILVRGLAQPDSVPVDDIGIRGVIGRYLGSGQRVKPDEALEMLEPFRPYRGLLAFYLLVKYRLDRQGREGIKE